MMLIQLLRSSRVGCRGFAATATANSKASTSTSTDNAKGAEKWDLSVGVAIIRPAIIAPSMSELEQHYERVLNQHERNAALLSQFEVQLNKDKELVQKRQDLEAAGKSLSELDEEIGITSIQKQEDWIRFEEKTRDQLKLGDNKAIANEDMKAINRKLDQKLILMIRQKFGQQTSPWILPQLKNNSEMLRHTVEKCLGEVFTSNATLAIESNAPLSVYRYRYPRALAEKLQARGNYIFIYATYINDAVTADVSVNNNFAADHRWCTADELASLTPRIGHRNDEYCEAIDRQKVDRNFARARSF